MVHVQPGGIILENNSKIIVLILLGIDEEDLPRTLQANLRAVRAVGRVLPYRTLRTAGYVEGQARGDRAHEQPDPEGT